MEGMKEDLKAQIEDLISTNKVMLFSKSYCPFCKATKKLLDSKKVEYVAYELDLEPQGAALHAQLKDISGHKTVPNVYINGKHIGGNDTMQELEQAGKLDELLK